MGCEPEKNGDPARPRAGGARKCNPRFLWRDCQAKTKSEETSREARGRLVTLRSSSFLILHSSSKSEPDNTASRPVLGPGTPYRRGKKEYGKSRLLFFLSGSKLKAHSSQLSGPFVISVRPSRRNLSAVALFKAGIHLPGIKFSRYPEFAILKLWPAIIGHDARPVGQPALPTLGGHPPSVFALVRMHPQTQAATQKTRRLWDMLLGYLDPASGSLLLQLLIGSVVGLGLFFRQNVARVFRLFRRSTS